MASSGRLASTMIGTADGRGPAAEQVPDNADIDDENKKIGKTPGADHLIDLNGDEEPCRHNRQPFRPYLPQMESPRHRQIQARIQDSS